MININKSKDLFVIAVVLFSLQAAKLLAQTEETGVVSSATKEEYIMEPIVRVVTIDPIRVAVCNRVSASPEKDSYEALRAWAEPQGLLEDPVQFPIFLWLQIE